MSLRTASYREEVRGLMDDELPAFDDALVESGLPRIVTGDAAPAPR